jgi:hypothetical protein
MRQGAAVDAAALSVGGGVAWNCSAGIDGIPSGVFGDDGQEGGEMLWGFDEDCMIVGAVNDGETGDGLGMGAADVLVEEAGAVVESEATGHILGDFYLEEVMPHASDRRWTAVALPSDTATLDGDEADEADISATAPASPAKGEVEVEDSGSEPASPLFSHVVLFSKPPEAIGGDGQLGEDSADELLRRFQPVHRPSRLAVEAMNCSSAELSEPIVPVTSLEDLEGLVGGLVIDDDAAQDVSGQ